MSTRYLLIIIVAGVVCLFNAAGIYAGTAVQDVIELECQRERGKEAVAEAKARISCQCFARELQRLSQNIQQKV